MTEQEEVKLLGPAPKPRLKDKVIGFIERTSKNEKIIAFGTKIVHYVDYSLNFLFHEKDEYNERLDATQKARKPIVFGTWVMIITFGVFGLWAVTAPLNSASVARGVVVVDSNKKTVQHLEGGIISEIFVKNGDEVQKGQLLMKLDDTKFKAILDSLASQYYSTLALEARLIAERDNKETISFAQDLEDQKADVQIAKYRDSQERLFKARAESIKNKIDIYHQKIEQSKNEIESLQAQKTSAAEQLKLVNQEIDVVQQLISHGQATRPRLLERQARAQALKGMVGELSGKIAQVHQAISSTDIEIIALQNNFLNEVVGELKDVQIQLADLRERMKSSTDSLVRTSIVSPVDGEVNDLKFYTIGGVIPQGAPIMEIIPRDDQLVIEAQVRPNDIDVVYPGLIAQVRLNAYKSRNTPPIEGKVTYVSADAIKSTDLSMGTQYFYNARITIDKEKFKDDPRLKNVKLYPGMVADVLIVTGSRTMLQYLLDPITDSIRHSFIEK